MNLLDYLKSRMKEKDTHTVVAASAYTIGRAFVPPQYQMVLDLVAAALGSAIVATPNNGDKTQVTNTVTTTETTELVPPNTGVAIADNSKPFSLK